MVTRPGSAPELFYDPGGGHAFNPINPDTGMFSRFPHVSTPDAGPVHATDIDRAKTAQLSIKDGTFSGPGGGAAGKKFVLAQGRPPDEYGRLNFGRENNAIKKGFVEPLSPRTVKHLSSGGAHRLANATYSEIDAVPVDARLSAALAGRYNPVASQENHLAWAASQAAASGAAASPSSMAPTPPTRAASTSSAASPSEVDFKSPTDGGSKNK